MLDVVPRKPRHCRSVGDSLADSWSWVRRCPWARRHCFSAPPAQSHEPSVPCGGTGGGCDVPHPQASARPAISINRPDILDLEPAVAQAELILTVRLADVTETKIVHGGRNVEVTQQYRFEPVQVLKGIFARGELLMTGQDLGIYRFAEGPDRLERGQLMLVLLGTPGPELCQLQRRPDARPVDPPAGQQGRPAARRRGVLIGMTRKRDRAERVALLRDGLKRAKGRDAVPLLLALGRRALLAARDPGIAEAVLPHLKTASPALREVAARTLAALLDSIPGRAPRRAAAPRPARSRPRPRRRWSRRSTTPIPTWPPASR